MNILYITLFFVGFMISEIARVSVFGNSPYSGTFRIRIFVPTIQYHKLKFAI